MSGVHARLSSLFPLYLYVGIYFVIFPPVLGTVEVGRGVIGVVPVPARRRRDPSTSWSRSPGRDDGARRSASPAAIMVSLTVAETTASDFVPVPLSGATVVDRRDDGHTRRPLPTPDGGPSGARSSRMGSLLLLAAIGDDNGDEDGGR